MSKRPSDGIIASRPFNQTKVELKLYLAEAVTATALTFNQTKVELK